MSKDHSIVEFFESEVDIDSYIESLVDDVQVSGEFIQLNKGPIQKKKKEPEPTTTNDVGYKVDLRGIFSESGISNDEDYIEEEYKVDLEGIL